MLRLCRRPKEHRRLIKRHVLSDNTEFWYWRNQDGELVTEKITDKDRLIKSGVIKEA